VEHGGAVLTRGKQVSFSGCWAVGNGVGSGECAEEVIIEPGLETSQSSLEVKAGPWPGRLMHEAAGVLAKANRSGSSGTEGVQ
jgi:hypothetical protein